MKSLETDALVIGSGIAGLQAALDLADQGYRVTIAEKAPSIGGKMISLSKVFPTLDCASCITTPRMASAANHRLISTLTMTEAVKVEKGPDGRFTAVLKKQPRYVREQDCISCKRCEDACPVLAPDEYEQGLGARKAIAIPFTNAVPQFPVLHPEDCIRCGACARACPKDCIDFLQQPEELTVSAGAVILATGFETTPMTARKQYGAGLLENVLPPLAAERLLAPHGPYGRVLRPSDGKVPDSIGFVLCAGSRDSSIGVPYCSRVCCMFSIKQAVLLAGSLPTADITVYYMDIRAFGKGYEQFYSNAAAMGINFVKAKVGRITEDKDRNPVLRIERQESPDSAPEEIKHDLVILSQGLLPCAGGELCPAAGRDSYGFTASADGLLTPQLTLQEGIFAAGTARGPRDIPDTVIDAGAAAALACGYLKKTAGRSS